MYVNSIEISDSLANITLRAQKLFNRSYIPSRGHNLSSFWLARICSQICSYVQVDWAERHFLTFGAIPVAWIVFPRVSPEKTLD